MVLLNGTRSFFGAFSSLRCWTLPIHTYAPLSGKFSILAFWFLLLIFDICDRDTWDIRFWIWFRIGTKGCSRNSCTLSHEGQIWSLSIYWGISSSTNFVWIWFVFFGVIQIRVIRSILIIISLVLSIRVSIDMFLIPAFSLTLAFVSDYRFYKLTIADKLV